MAGKFNPDEFLSKTAPTSAAFDPDDFAQAPRPPDEPVSRGAAAARGFVRGASGGWSDEAAGALESLAPALGLTPGELWDWAKSGFPDLPRKTYTQARDEHRALDAKTDQQRPYWSGAGRFGGAVATAAKLPATTASSVIQGAVTGLGESEASDARGMAADAAWGGALGYAGDKVGKAVGSAVPRVARWAREKLEDYAAERALKAAGYIQKDLKGMTLADPENISRAGRVLLEEVGLIRPFERVSDIAERLPPSIDAHGDQIGRAYAEADALGARFDPEPLLQRVESEILEPIARDPAVRTEAAELRRLIDGYREAATEVLPPGTVGPPRSVGVPFAEAGAQKSNLQKTINFGTNPLTGKPGANAERFVKQLQGQFGDEIERQLAQTVDDGTMAAFRDSMSRYGPLKESLAHAREGMAREGGNAALGLRDYIAGTAAGAMAQAFDMNPAVASVGAAIGNKVIRERADSTLAYGANRLANSDWLESLVTKNPEVLGRWGGYLSRAAAQSPEALATAHWVLSESDPEYAKAVANAAQQQGGAR